jgi:hypothetical protein
MKSWVALAVAVVLVPTAACGQRATGEPTVEASSITRDEISVYETVLASWLGKEKRQQLVDENLSAAPSAGDSDVSDCAKGVVFSADSRAVRGKKSLAGVQFKRSGIKLIDGTQWKPADPAEGIAEGKSVDAAVREGFSKSLISFSQIAFSRDGNDALVKISMVCGGLCGSGSTLHLHRSSTGWTILSRCGEWIS